MKHLSYLALLCAALLVGCGGSNDDDPANDGGTTPGDDDSGTTNPGEDSGSDGPVPTGFVVEPVAQLDEPWAMTFLPDGRLLVTEQAGALKLVTTDGAVGDISGVPDVDFGGQGGLGDVILHPDFADNSIVYLSWVEAGGGGNRGAAVGRATLELDGSGGGSLQNLEVIWRQTPKVDGRGHFGHRLAFSPDGYLFISSGERQNFDPAQDMSTNLGKIVRLNDDGSVPDDNPFQEDGEVARQVWTLGHRNPLGLVFDGEGRLWEHEMGPEGGDELNLIVRGENYGYPLVSNGDHYGGEPIPDHSPGDGFYAPKEWWNPVISPSSIIIYSGDVFPNWRGDALIGGLSSQALIRVELGEDSAEEAERFDMGERIRGIEESADGDIYLLEDEGQRLLKVVPTYE